MIIDCERCTARPSACGDCVIGVVLRGDADPGRPTSPSGAVTLSLDAPEQRALDALAEHGLIPRLRLVSTRTHPVHTADAQGGGRRDAG